MGQLNFSISSMKTLLILTILVLGTSGRNILDVATDNNNEANFPVDNRNDASEEQPTTTTQQELILEPREIEDTTILNLEPRISDDDDTAEEMTTQLILQPRNSDEENIEFITEFYTQPRISEVDLLEEFSAEDLQMDFNPDEITTISPK